LYDAHFFLLIPNISFPRFRAHSHMNLKVMKVQELQTKKIQDDACNFQVWYLPIGTSRIRCKNIRRTLIVV